MDVETSERYKKIRRDFKHQLYIDVKVGDLMSKAHSKYLCKLESDIAYLKWKRQNFLSIYERDAGICFWCHDKVSKKKATLDHLTPISRGGKLTAFYNVTICCPDCNGKKGHMTGEEYINHLCTK